MARSRPLYSVYFFWSSWSYWSCCQFCTVNKSEAWIFPTRSDTVLEPRREARPSKKCYCTGLMIHDDVYFVIYILRVRPDFFFFLQKFNCKVCIFLHVNKNLSKSKQTHLWLSFAFFFSSDCWMKSVFQPRYLIINEYFAHNSMYD